MQTSGHLNRYTRVVLFISGMILFSSSEARPDLPEFNHQAFDESLTIDNRYFPLHPGTILTYEAELHDSATGKSKIERTLVEVLNETKTILGINCRVVRDRVWAEELLIEDTYDWYAQDNAGNVWYMGEHSTEYNYNDKHMLTGASHAGSWEAGKNNAKPSYIMQADPQIGAHYYQEYRPGEAEDEGEVIALGEIHSVPVGTFDDVLHTRDSTALEPDVVEHKFYAPGLGIILERELNQASGEVIAVLRLTAVVGRSSDQLVWE